MKPRTHLRKRSGGLLLHITSLPSVHGIGDLGPTARRFADLLLKAGQSSWQILPLTPTSTRYGNSPYNSESVLAGNPLLISPEELVEEGLLSESSIHAFHQGSPSRVDYAAVTQTKTRLLQMAYERFRRKPGDYSDEFEAFCAENSGWLDDYSLYRALKAETDQPWHRWPRPLRNRDQNALNEARKRLSDLVETECFTQFLFFRQWRDLKRYCRRLGISVIGDIPFYVNYDSVDVWANPRLFRLDAKKRPLFVGGVPPDYFSEEGQLWGNPVYDWEEMSATQFEWWMTRIEHTSRLFDVLRLDHFRGLLAYWEVPAGSKTAADGRWVETPSAKFFEALFRRFLDLPMIAEDLGVLTPEVRDTMTKFGLPGLKVLIFAFDGSPENTHLPHNHPAVSVAMTGTHDTNTVLGWFTQEASRKVRRTLYRYVGRRLKVDQVGWELIRLALMSVAQLSIVPVQDVLSLGAEARMNHPARSVGNWEWRATAEQLDGRAFDRLREMTETFGRC